MAAVPATTAGGLLTAQIQHAGSGRHFAWIHFVPRGDDVVATSLPTERFIVMEVEMAVQRDRPSDARADEINAVVASTVQVEIDVGRVDRSDEGRVPTQADAGVSFRRAPDCPPTNPCR